MQNTEIIPKYEELMHLLNSISYIYFACIVLVFTSLKAVNKPYRVIMEIKMCKMT